MKPGKKDLEKSRADTPGTGSSLREHAEERFACSGPIDPGLAGQASGELIHELQVHHIELEMQAEELRRAYLALEESRDRYIDLYDFAPVGYLTLTDKGFVSEANLTGALLLGIERKNLIKNRFSRLVAESDRDAWHRYFMGLLGTTEKQACTLTLTRGNNGTFPARTESIRITDQFTGTTTVRVAISDISDLRQIEDELNRKSEEVQAINEDLVVAGEKLRQDETKLKVSLEEKEALLSEIHHRVKNNLMAFISLLSLDGTYEESDSGRRLRNDLQNRARSMALIHETLYRTRKFSTVDMSEYLSTLTGQVAGSYEAGNSVHTVVSAAGIDLDLTKATPCGLIVNELITNVFKHAFPASFDCESARGSPCTLSIRLTLADGIYTLAIQDNGIGLPDTFDPATARSLGLKLVNFLAKHQLRATTDILRDNGTEFRFHFRKENTDKTRLR